jgi:hypothetical protein
MAWLLALPAGAVIVGGTNGDGFNNAGGSTLQTFLTTASAPAFPYWNNLIRYSDASAIYLGYNPSTMEGWVLSANHITETTNITVGGYTYPFIDPLPLDANQNGTRLVPGGVNTDLVLYKFSVGGAAPIPVLPTIAISTSAAAVGESMIMAGRGLRLNAGTGSEDTVAPYSWGTPGTSDAVPFRWGSNLVGGVGIFDGAGGEYIATNFNAPGTSTAFDGQASLGDSGGSGFILRGGAWWLAGLMYAVDDGPDADALVDPAGYGDVTYFTDVYAYRSDIAGITGTLVPEPSVCSLLAMALMVWKRRRS